jgi:DNA-binding NtrC family response regulator
MANSKPMPQSAVLIVEDDPLLRMLAVDVVTDAGLVSIEASGADEAKEILKRRSDIAVLFTDIDMPGSMNGIGLAQWAKGAMQSIKIIITSGHSSLDGAEGSANWIFVPKPYDIDRVTEKIKHLATL